MEGPKCQTCGGYEVRITPVPWLDGDALPHDVDLFRPSNGSTFTFVTERFVEVLRPLGPCDVSFQEACVSPKSRSGSVH
jgi:hypothetical protein